RARVGSALDAGGNVDRVAQQVIALDHNVAHMNADTQRQATLAVGVLDRSSASHGLNSTGKFDQKAVAHRLEQPTYVLGDLGLDHLGPQNLKLRQRSGFVAADQLRVTDHVGHQDRGKAALLGHSGMPTRRKPSANFATVGALAIASRLESVESRVSGSSC